MLRPLITFGGIAAIVSGGLRVATSFVAYDPQSALQELVFGIVDAGLLFGVMGVYLRFADRIGRLGLVSFAVALIAIASILGPDTNRFGIDFYWMGASVFLFALSGMAVALLQQRLLVPAATSWLISLVLGLAASTGHALAFAASGLALGFGFLFAGIALVRGSDPVRLRQNGFA